MKAFRVFILVLGLCLVYLSLSVYQDGTMLALETSPGAAPSQVLVQIGKLAIAVAANNGTTTRVSVDSAGFQGNGYSVWSAVSSDGRFVTFESEASNLVANDTNFQTDVFVHDRQTGQTTRVSVDSAGVQGNSWSEIPAISSDGRFVSFKSGASNLVPNDTNFRSDIFIHDRQSGQTSRVSVDSAGTQGNNSSYGSALSASGRFVAFNSRASNLVPNDTNERTDVFVHDRQTGQTTRVSVDSGGVQSNNESEQLTISADGHFVAFEWWPSDVPGETNGPSNIYVHDRQTNQTSLVSADSAGLQGNDGSRRPALSADGHFVAFSSSASNLVPNDTNDEGDIFVRDRQSGQTSLVSVDSAGVQGNESSGYPAISTDGRFVAFRSLASNLVPGDTNYDYDVFVHDRQTGQTTRVSVDSAGVQSNDWSGRPAISADGHFVVFQSEASNLVPGDTNGESDIFVHDLGSSSSGTAISGTVRDRFGVSLVGVTVNAGAGGTSVTDAAGFYSFIDVAPGTYTVTPSHNDYAFTPDSRLVSVPPEASGVDFVGTHADTDTDGDGLFDVWETQGIDSDGDDEIDIDLPAMGADPDKKDIFVEVDWMSDDNHSHQPQPEAIEEIVDSFANSPIDGGGVNLHVDVGPDSIDYVTGETWGDLSGGNSIAHQDILGQVSLADDLTNIMNANFATVRSQVFHYAIFGHQWHSAETDCSSGLSYGNGWQILVVTMGCFNNGIGTFGDQAGSFMHELGHNLGLNHGGHNEVNYKPNYLSIMNYSFQLGGLIINGTDGHYDYSRFDLPDLDESQLSEPDGLNGGSEIDNFGTKFNTTFPWLCVPDWAGNVGFTVADAANGPINWDCNVGVDQDPVQEDSNDDGEITTLQSHDDWANLDYTAGAIGSAGAPPPIVITDDDFQYIPKEITPDEDRLIQRVPKVLYLPIIRFH